MPGEYRVRLTYSLQQCVMVSSLGVPGCTKTRVAYTVDIAGHTIGREVMRNKALLVVGLTVLALLLVGCGSDSDSKSKSTPEVSTGEIRGLMVTANGNPFSGYIMTGHWQKM